MDAPVCLVPTGPIIQQPDPAKFPTIPQAVDLPSALVSLNAIRQILAQLTGLVPITGTGDGSGGASPGGGGGAAGGGGGGAASSSPASNQPKSGQDSQTLGGRFIEDKSKRVTKQEKVYDPNDHTVYVTVERINRVVWVDKLTGQTIVWQR